MEKQGVEGTSIQGSWVPQTPVRPVMPKPAPIYSDTQEIKEEQANRVEPERGFPAANISALDHMPFVDLLALANVASTAFVGAAPWAYHGGFGGSSNSQATFRYMNAELSNGSHSAALGNSRAEETQCGNPAFQQETRHAISPRGCCEFLPITPNKLTGNQMQNQTTVQRPGSEDIQCIMENREPICALSLAAASVPGELSNNTGNGGSQGIEQIKTPQKPRRRKHRPKVIKEAKPKKDPKPKAPKEKAPKPSEGQENRTPKRKYVRKKGVDKDPESTPTEAAAELADAETLNPAKKSCRRALDFENQIMPKDENHSNLNSDAQRVGHCNGENPTRLGSDAPGESRCNGENQLNPHAKLADEMEAVAKEQVGIASDPKKHSGNQESKECVSNPEGQAPGTPLPTKRKPRQRKRNPHQQKEPKEIGRNAGSTHHDLRFIARFMAQFANSVVSLSEGRQGKESMSENLKSTDQTDARDTNLLGLQYNSVHEYQKLSWLYFPNMQRKKMTPKDQNSTMSSISFSVSGTNNIVGQGIEAHTGTSVPNSKCGGFASQPNNDTGKCNLNGVQNLEPNMDLDQKDASKKKRSRGHARFRDLASINKVLQGNAHLSHLCGQLAAERDSRPETSIEAVISEMQSALSKKKRTKKAKEAQTNQNPQNHYQFSASSAGISPDELWKHVFSIDAISERLRLLDINRERPYLPYQETALVPYTMKNQENALVLFRGDGTIVPFEGPFSPVRKRRSRPKVNLDNETSRVWRLLMGNINSEGIDGTDEEKAKWWEEERRVFQGRADSFIARMHLVQGDRRFTPWKGSVVDSVVGVFLTQNVADHLSSSAFMSLAAQFPVHSVCNRNPGEGTSLMLQEPIVYLDSEESMSTTPVCNQSTVTLDKIRHSVEKEVVNSGETSRSSSEIVSSTNESIGKMDNSSVKVSETCSDLDPKNSNIEVEKISQTYLVEDCKAIQDLLPSEDSVLTSQNSIVSVAQITEKTGSCSESNSEGEDLRKTLNLSNINGHTSFMELLQMAGSSLLQGQGIHSITSGAVSMEEHISIQKNLHDTKRQNIEDPSDPKSSPGVPKMSPRTSSTQFTSNQGESEVKSFNSSTGEVRSSNENNEPSCSCQEDGDIMACHQSEMLGGSGSFHSNNEAQNKQKEELINLAHKQRAIPDVTESTSSLDNQLDRQKPPDPDLKQHGDSCGKELDLKNGATSKPKGKNVFKEKKDEFDWDSLRREAEGREGKRGRTSRTMDSVDWEAVRTADVDEIAKTIKDRGMNNVLAGRIQDFLNRLVREHGSVDLEWLRDIPPDKAKEYLLSFRGLGLKSVECVRLLTLHHLAFPVDTNVGRIAVRLGWVPLQPLPESLQLHLLELYPVLESIQKYLWPRLCKLDQRTLYELHYQMITFGKVFCTKSKPNCNACPMRGECRHFASAFAREDHIKDWISILRSSPADKARLSNFNMFCSARLSLPGPEEKSIVGATENRTPDNNPPLAGDQGLLSLPQAERLEGDQGSEVTGHSISTKRVTCCEPIIEEPASPEPECTQVSEIDIEDAFFEDPEEIPTIRLNMDAFTNNLKNYMEQNMELQEGDMSKALVALTAEAASIPMPKLKNVSQLRTEHQVYELPDSHPLLVGLDKREPDDPCSYLLAIWTPGETADSIQPPDRKCSSQENGTLCDEKTCFSCNSIREARSQTVRGTLLIPCRTAMRGSFPLNGTYFQVNEVFADHDSSLNPIDVPRDWIWNLPRKTVYFGTSIPTIFRGLTTESIQHCFWRGYVCVRGFDLKTRAPRPLIARLHFPASKLGRSRGTRE